MESLLLFMFFNLMGVMSPGPDFAIVARYSMLGSLRASLLATLGICAALLIHSIYCLLGVALFLKNSPVYFHLIQGLGSLYLGYMGIGMIQEGWKKEEHRVDQGGFLNKTPFLTGFLTNLMNPKAMIFLLSLFTQFVGPETAWPMKIVFALSLVLVVFSWFATLSFLLTHPRFYEKIRSYQFVFTLTMGFLLTGLSIYMLGSSFHHLKIERFNQVSS